MTPIALAILIFLLRIGDVSLGTLRTISVVRGKIRASMIFALVEILIWSVAITQVFAGEAPTIVFVGYVSGYAAGNAVGIVLEQRFAKRNVIFTVLSSDNEQMIKELKQIDDSLSIKEKSGIIYIKACKTFAGRIARQAKKIDPDATCIVQDEIE